MQLFHPRCRTSNFLLKPYFRFLTEPPYWRFLLAQFLCLIKVALEYSSALRHVSNSTLTYRHPQNCWGCALCHDLRHWWRYSTDTWRILRYSAHCCLPDRCQVMIITLSAYWFSQLPTQSLLLVHSSSSFKWELCGRLWQKPYQICCSLQKCTAMLREG